MIKPRRFERLERGEETLLNPAILQLEMFIAQPLLILFVWYTQSCLSRVVIFLGP